MTPTLTVSQPHPTITSPPHSGPAAPICADLDMLVLHTGAIVAAVGTWQTWPVRARLCYYPDPTGAVTINGSRHAKVTYERASGLPGLEQVLALPGENHYLVHRHDVRQHLTTVPAPATAPRPVREHVHAFENAGLAPRLGGSRLLGIDRPDSDYDWVIWGNNPDHVRAVVTREQRAVPALHFGLAHAMRKYEHFHHLNPVALKRLFTDRWRHVTWPRDGLDMSYLPASRTWLADPWRSTRRAGLTVRVTGTVADTSNAYFAPTLIGLDTAEGAVNVATWLFLYRGAFNLGDAVTVHGRLTHGPAGPVIFVEGSDDAIIKH